MGRMVPNGDISGSIRTLGVQDDQTEDDSRDWVWREGFGWVQR